MHDERIDGINVHYHGPHIFHTNDDEVWKFVNRFARFIQYEHRVKGMNQGRIFPVPVNLMTMYLLWGVTTAAEAKQKIEETRVICDNPQNLEEWILHSVGRDLYELVVKGFTEKQWGRPCKNLPAGIIKRLPVRMTWDDRYHNERYSGLPEDGYTGMIANMLDGIRVELGVDYFDKRDHWDSLGKKVVYTGPVDRFFDYQHGDLHYRSLRFEVEKKMGDVQGCPQFNYTERDVPYTRTIEWKHFERLECPHTIFTREYPLEWERGIEPYYPILDEANKATYAAYKAMAGHIAHKYLIGGRLGTYKYMDMDQTIGQALRFAQRMLSSSAGEMALQNRS
jgi:UDP-galactopyranose mutase